MFVWKEKIPSERKQIKYAFIIIHLMKYPFRKKMLWYLTVAIFYKYSF